MGVGINIPKRPADNSGQLLSLAGTVVGGAFGGPPGAAIGGQAGSMLAPKPQAGPDAVESNPMARRKEQMDQDGLAQLSDSINSLQYIPDEEQRAALAKPLLQAGALAKSRV